MAVSRHRPHLSDRNITLFLYIPIIPRKVSTDWVGNFLKAEVAQSLKDALYQKWPNASVYTNRTACSVNCPLTHLYKVSNYNAQHSPSSQAAIKNSLRNLSVPLLLLNLRQGTLPVSIRLLTIAFILGFLTHSTTLFTGRANTMGGPNLPVLALYTLYSILQSVPVSLGVLYLANIQVLLVP